VAAADPFLPMTLHAARRRGWDEVDFVVVSGDAYVDHPAFGAALVGRFVQSLGYRVGVIAQPDWRSADAFRALGRPRLAFGVTAGNLDSMLARLTAQRKPRREDLYSPGGRPGLRPDRASVVYAQRCREAFPDVPVILGGIEASLRRLAHYDYWSDTVRRSVLLDAKADLLVYGMAEAPLREVLARLAAGEHARAIRGVRGTCRAVGAAAAPTCDEAVPLPSYEEVAADPRAFARAARLFHLEQNPFSARPLVQPHGDRAVVQEPPALPLDTAALDALYALPFTRAAHPAYDEPVPGLQQVQASITTVRGCFGGCAFCSLTEHQGRVVQSRSVESVVAEARAVAALPAAHGVITDLGGPTANFYRMRCRDPERERRCGRLSCVHPDVCRHLGTDAGPLLELWRAVRRTPGVRHVFVGSGIRYDVLRRSPEAVRELAAHHTSGHLKVAPEHVSEPVLRLMRKPAAAEYDRFAADFAAASPREQYLVPYFMSGHPGTTLGDMVELALFLKRRRLRPRQVQEFIPTPMTLATAMYHTGLDPMSGRPVAVARGLREKRLQKALLLAWDPAEHERVREALREAGRVDLIGRGPGALVPPAGRDAERPTPRPASPAGRRAPGRSRMGARGHSVGPRGRG
jgi:uncharacterized radical SAM protein YgiQ